MTLSWKDWSPGFDNDAMTLEEAQNTLPGNEPDEIHFIIRLFENPSSPIAFKGAITLERHDLVHILLGRGLLPQDEAFVIGFTMGTSKKISTLESWLFQTITKHLYPPPYNFNDNHLQIFRLGLDMGNASHTKSIYDIPLEEYKHQTLAEIRSNIGIDMKALKTAYRLEKELLPDTRESKRLEV